jgi:DNA helicase-2/ATP-dependent DNA helicase PcrA
MNPSPLHLYFHRDHWTRLDLIQAAKSFGLRNYSKASRRDLETWLTERLRTYVPPASQFRLFNKPYPLSSDQYDAVTYIRGNHKVIAGAGAGKTRCLIGKILYLLQQGADPHDIIAITFTRDAYLEMRERLTTFIGTDIANQVQLGTIHSFAYNYCRRQDSYIKCRIIDEKDAKRWMRKMAHGTGIKGEHALSIYDKWRDKWYPKSLAEIVNEDEYEILSQIFHRYQEEKQQHHLLDFADILHNFRQQVTDHDFTNGRWILVDEAQDLNALQHEILMSMNRRIQNMTYYGDDWQSIYMFRGGSGSFFVNYTAHETILSINYRSVSEIVQFCNPITRTNRDQIHKLMIADRERCGQLPTVHLFPHMDEETRWITDHMKQSHLNGTSYHQMAILARTNDELATYEMACTIAGIPCIRRKGNSLFDIPFIQWLIAGWKLQQCDHPIYREILWHEMHHADITTCPTTLPNLLQELGANMLARMIAVGSEEERDMIHLLWIKLILQHVPAEASRDAEHMLKRFAEASLAYPSEWDYLDQLHITYEQGVKRPSNDHQDAVALITVHASKGLEWSSVYVVGLNDGRCPHYKAPDWRMSLELVEEERRLFFVACSRARDQLHLTYRPMENGSQTIQTTYLSPFVKEIPPYFWTGVAIFRPCDGSLISRIRCGTPSILCEILPWIEEERGDDSDMQVGSGSVTRLQMGHDVYQWRNLVMMLEKLVETGKRTAIVHGKWKIHITNWRRFMSWYRPSPTIPIIDL